MAIDGCMFCCSVRAGPPITAAKSGSATLKFVSGDKRLVEEVLLMARPANLLKAEP